MKAIILYTTKHGCAEEVAKVLQCHLGAGTERVNLMKAQPDNLAMYDTVILGGSVYFGRVQKNLRHFIHQERTNLAGKNLGLFICAGAQGSKAEAELDQIFPKELRDHATVCAVLGDKIVSTRLSRFEKWVVRIVDGTKGNRGGLHNDKIHEFASSLYKE